eukprot:NODE_1800_length_838_cov_78.479087_g1419_i0.p1 GENE.NODE_1800_length_838_cov_78.479087_g1419_i0~~NODE_1800_length_838_cov_78.479087_g1419_i0.p1  ORF type:complete len:90 (+),score=16.58 NODE_1800_length_838_cov_78.479087_g1419_i0:189-458(+)
MITSLYQQPHNHCFCAPLPAISAQSMQLQCPGALPSSAVGHSASCLQNGWWLSKGLGLAVPLCGPPPCLLIQGMAKALVWPSPIGAVCF